MQADVSNRRGLADERFVPDVHRGELIEAEHYARYLWASALAAGVRVLDAGCGVGYGAGMLANAGASEVVGIDVSDAAIRAAGGLGLSSVSFLPGDLHDLPFDDSRFDLVVCFEVIEHVTDRDGVLDELRRVLTPGGVLVISSPNRDVYPPGNPHHVYEYRPEELRDALRARFDHVELRRQHDWVASVILDDRDLGQDTLQPLAALEAAKTLPAPPGSEPYTLAIASREPLPDPHPRAVFTSVNRTHELIQETHALRDERHRLVAEADRERRLATATRDERDRVRRDFAALLDIERSLRADASQLLEELDAVRGQLRRVQRSLSWRLTRPMRNARGAVGRGRARGKDRSADD